MSSLIGSIVHVVGGVNEVLWARPGTFMSVNSSFAFLVGRVEGFNGGALGSSERHGIVTLFMESGVQRAFVASRQRVNTSKRPPRVLSEEAAEYGCRSVSTSPASWNVAV